jgi:Ca-activated chloride channel family protein
MNVEKDYYNILEVSPLATDDEIRLSYRKLVRIYHPDVNRTADAAEKFRDIQEAYELLSVAQERKKYDHWRAQQGLDKSSALSVHTIPSHKSLVSLPNEQAYYVLLSIMPTSNLPTSRLPLNICLVLDRSTSMKDAGRMQQVKEAVNKIIEKLQPEDALSLIVFSDRAQVLLPSQRHIDKAQAKSVVSTIQPSGGTEILQGLLAGLEEIQRYQTNNSVNHLILLTDGRTYGDKKGCVEQAQWAGANKIHLSAIGVGTDWDEDLLDEMADLSGGVSIFINTPDSIKNIFSQTMQNLETVVARELAIKIKAGLNVKLHEAHQTTPHICRLETVGQEIKLGSLSAQQEKSILLEFRIGSLPTGEHNLMRIMVEGDMPGEKNRSWEWVELKTRVTLQPDPEAKIPSQITTTLSKLAIYRMQQKVAEDLAAGRVDKATQRLQLIATRLLDLGEPELSRAALLEAGQLARTSTLSAEGRKKIRYGTRMLTSANETTALGTRLVA